MVNRPDEAENIQHRRVEADEASAQRAEPVEHLDGGRDGDHEGEERERDAGVERRAGHEHMVTPDEEADHRNRDRGPRDKAITEDGLARERRDDFAHHAEPRQDHDVDRRMGVEPEEVLEQQWITAEGGIEDAEAEDALADHEDQDHGQHRGRPRRRSRRSSSATTGTAAGGTSPSPADAAYGWLR